MSDLIQLCRSQPSITNCSGLNASASRCDTCGKTRHAAEEHRWWSHLYQCRKRSQGRLDCFAEFCFLCLIWYDDRTTWRKHVQEHMLDLPLKCNMVVFRHNVVRPALCPACLGQGQFRQFINLTTWKSHLQNHLLRPNMQTCPHPRCQSRPTEKSGPAFLDHLADAHHIRFEKAKRQKALKAAAAAGKPARAGANAFSFVHVNSEQYAKSGADDRGDREGHNASTVTTAAGSPHILSAGEDTILAMQDDLDSQLVLDDVDDCLEDDYVVVGRESCDHGFQKASETKEADVRVKTKILVMVPPVPDSWDSGDILCIDTLDDDTDVATVAEQARSSELPRQARGRPRGSRNRRV